MSAASTMSQFETKDHEDKIASARAFVLKKAPYFASVVYGFIYRPVEGARTMFCTPKMILGYDPEWAVIATVEELAADIAHEVHHFKRGHFERAVGFEDKRRYNKAGDLAINPDLKAGGWTLAKGPRGAIFPEMFKTPDGKPFPDGLTTEQYYELLRQAGDEGEDGSGDGVCHGCCGGMGGNPSNKELENKLDAVPNVGRTETEKKSIEKRLANDIEEYVKQNGRGSVPGNVLDWTKTFEEEPHIRWEDELAGVLRDTTGRMQSGGDDFSMRRPSKRSFLRGFPRPGLIEHLPEVAIVRDSSMSMGQKQLTDAARESYYIVQALGIEEVWFCDADTDVAGGWKRVGSQFFKELTEAHGRGGTDFRPAIEEAQKLTPKPDILVYVTDGDGTTTAMPPPDVTVVWCIVPSHYNMAPADWGHCVIISDDKKVRKKKVMRPKDLKAAINALKNNGTMPALDDDDTDTDDPLDDGP